MARPLILMSALLIAVTAQHMAVARGTMKDAAGQVVLCTGAGVQTVTVDRNGAPVDLVHICPDCILAAWMLLLGHDGVFGREAQVSVVAQPFEKIASFGFDPRSAKARAPPILV